MRSVLPASILQMQIELVKGTREQIANDNNEITVNFMIPFRFYSAVNQINSYFLQFSLNLWNCQKTNYSFYTYRDISDAKAKPITYN